MNTYYTLHKGVRLAWPHTEEGQRHHMWSIVAAVGVMMILLIFIIILTCCCKRQCDMRAYSREDEVAAVLVRARPHQQYGSTRNGQRHHLITHTQRLRP